jgi:hypothetical protein
MEFVQIRLAGDGCWVVVEDASIWWSCTRSAGLSMIARRQKFDVARMKVWLVSSGVSWRCSCWSLSATMAVRIATTSTPLESWTLPFPLVQTACCACRSGLETPRELIWQMLNQIARPSKLQATDTFATVQPPIAAILFPGSFEPRVKQQTHTRTWP